MDRGNVVLGDDGKPKLVGKVLPDGSIVGERPLRDDELTADQKRHRLAEVGSDEERKLRSVRAAAEREALLRAAEAMEARASSED
jgi:hypothetical protein